MSFAIMYKINPDGTLEGAAGYQNAHGFAAFVWTSLVERYGLTEDQWRADKTFEKEPMDYGMFGSWRYVWHLHAQGKLGLAPWEHNVLMATYDRYMVKAEDFQVFADSLETFAAEHNDEGKRVCHLKTMADDVRKLIDSDAIGVCWWPMNVSDNLWSTYDYETDESVWYNFVDEDNHTVAKILTQENS